MSIFLPVRHPKIWVALLAAPILSLASHTAHAATTFDLLVNHDAFQTGGAAVSAGSDVVDAPAGGNFVYRTKSKINGSTGLVSNAVLTQKLPSGAIFQGIDHPGGVNCTGAPVTGVTISSEVISCTISSLTNAEVHIDFKVTLLGDNTGHEAKASITAPDNSDPIDNNSNDIPRNVTTFERADLAVTFTGPTNGSSHEQGDVVNYQIQVKNTDATYAYPLKAGEKAVVRFSQPVGTVFQGSPSSAGNAWSCVAGTDNSTSPAIPVYDCTYTATADIPKNSLLPNIEIPVVVEANSGNTPATTSVKGQAVGGANFIDAYPDNNTSDVSINFTPNTKLDMKLVKTVSPTILDSTLATPQEVTYTLKVTRNSGGMKPEGITINDTLPSGVTFNAGVTGNGWSCSGTAVGATTVNCTFDNAQVPENGNLPDLTFKALITPNTIALTDGKAVLKNKAVLVVTNENDPTQINNTSQADLTISNEIALSTAKAAAKKNTSGDFETVSVIADGDEFYYEIKVHNDSSIPVYTAQYIIITDILDSQLEYLGAEGNWSCVANPLSWSASTPQTVTCNSNTGIAANGNNDLRLKVKAHLATGGTAWTSINNQASISCPSNRYCTKPIILTNAHELKISGLYADLSLTKSAAITADSSTYGPTASGAEVVYTLKVKNAVPSGKNINDFQEARTVVVTDTIENLLQSNKSTANPLPDHPITGTPRYANGYFVTAEVNTSNFPAGMSAPAEACEYTPDGNHTVKIKCTMNNVPVDNNIEYTITIKARQFVDSTSAGDASKKITNKASVTSPDTAEFDVSNNSDTADVTLIALTNMTAQKQASLNNARAGQKIDYTLNATNKGPSKAENVRIIDTLPLKMVWVTPPTITGGNCALADNTPITAGLEVTAANQVMTCTWNDPFDGGISDTTKGVTYSLRSVNVNYPASVKNDAIVRTDTPETIAWNAPSTDNTTDKTVNLDAPQVDVLINMGHTQDGLPAGAGDASAQTQYTITVTNSGASSSYATNVQMLDFFPADGSTAAFAIVGGAVDSVALKSGTNRFSTSDCKFVTTPKTGLQCDFDWLAPGESVDIKFTLEATAVTNGTIPVGTILHHASVSADAEALSSSADVSKNNTVTDRTSAYVVGSGINPADLRDLSIVKTVTSPTPGIQVKAGDQIEYLLTVKNEEAAGKNLVGVATVTDTLPAGLEIVGLPPAGCTYAARTLQCTITSLAGDTSTTFAFTTKVTTVNPGATDIKNIATVSSPNDPNPSNDKSEAPVPVVPVPKKPESIPVDNPLALLLLSAGILGFMARKQYCR